MNTTTQAIASTALTPVQLQPGSMLLMGPPGAGKTWSIATLLKAGLEVFVIGTEPNFVDSLLDAAAATKAPLDKLHWKTLKVVSPNWGAQKEVAQKTHLLSYADLADLKSGIAKSEMRGWLDLLLTCENFVDDRTGKAFGDVTEWDDSRALVIDSLTGLNQLAREYTTGYKPNLHPGEWGTAMELERNLIYKLAADRKCFFVLISHIDRGIDEVSQSSRITVSALGNKLGPKLPAFFSEVVLAKRIGNVFQWSTSELNADVKNRALPIGATLPADFTPIVMAHKRRKELMASMATASPTT